MGSEKRGIREFEAEQVRVESHDGVGINVWDYGGDGPPLLLCHCTGTHGRVWDPLVPPLLDHFHVYASDTRGHGDSERPEDPDSYSWAHSGRDLLAIADALELGDGIYGAGHSAGASHICYAEMFRAGTFSRVVLIDPIIGPAQAFQNENPLAVKSRRRRNEFESFDAAYERYASRPPLSAWDPAVLRSYVDHGFKLRPDGAVELKCPGYVEATVYENSGSSDVFEKLGELGLHAMLVTSDGSDVRTLAELQRERFTDPEYRVVAGASHFIPQERPDEVVKLVLEWLV